MCGYFRYYGIQNWLNFEIFETYSTNCAENDSWYTSRYVTKWTNPITLCPKLLKNNRCIPIRNKNKIGSNHKINQYPHRIRCNTSRKCHSKTRSKLKPILIDRAQKYRDKPRSGRSNYYDLIRSRSKNSSRWDKLSICEEII